VLAEWGVSPVELAEQWTDEMLFCLLEALVERKEREAKAWGRAGGSGGPEETVVSAGDMMGVVEKINRGRR